MELTFYLLLKEKKAFIFFPVNISMAVLSRWL